MNQLQAKLTQLCENRYSFINHSNCLWCEIKSEEELLHVSQILQPLRARICTITCYKEEVGHEIVYHFDIEGKILNLKLHVKQNSVTSITPYFKSADWTERELSELYGIELKNHPNPQRLFLDEKIKESVLDEYISLSNAMNGKMTQSLWNKVKQSREVSNG